MFKPSSAPVSLLEPPCPIIIEFTDYASYQHHELRRQQYQQQLELQEQKRQQEEDNRLYELQLQTQLQTQIQNQLQSQLQLQFQPAFQQQLYSTAQPTTFSTPFQQPPPLAAPSEGPSDFVYAYPQQPFSVADASSRGLDNANAGVQAFPGPELTSPAAEAGGGLVFFEENCVETQKPGYATSLATPAHPQLFSGSTAPSPLAPAPSPTPSAFPVISPPVDFSAASPANITATTAPASSLAAIAPPQNPRQHQHPRRPHHHHVNCSPRNDHPYSYHQHLQQQIQDRRTKRPQTLPIVHPSSAYEYAFFDPPAYVGNIHPSSSSLAAPLLSYQRLYQQSQQIPPPHAQYSNNHLLHAPHHIAMPADFAQTTALDQDVIAAEIAAQQAAAQSYRPDAEGPGIGEIYPAEDIGKLYTNADPSFVEKTQKLPRAFPLYRPVRGDGNCGWRAIGFCYFELLVHSGNADLLAQERARLLDLNDYIRNVGGYDPYVYEDMVEETDILFGNIVSVYPDAEKAMETVTTAFNDVGASNAIIYHLRLLAASYLKEHAEKYEGFLAHDMGVVGYCQDWIERPNCEIDHLRMELLTNVLLKSSDIVLEIAYLDRSESPLLPTYRFPESNIGRSESTIVRRMSLLFRPDHYDILYRPSQPSRAVAEAVLSRFHTPAHVAVALTQDWARSATIIAGEPVPPEQAVDASGTAAEPISAAVLSTSTPARSDAYPAHASLSAYENTPELTPGSSINSPAYFQHKAEPLTPDVAPAGGPAQAVSLVVEDGVLESAPAATSGLASGTTRVAGETAAGAHSLNAATPTANALHPLSSDERKMDDVSAGEGPASSAQEASGSAPALSAADVQHANDYKIFHVGSITYGAQQPMPSTGVDLLSQLPCIFGNAPSEVNAALFGTGTWSSSALRNRLSDTFAASPMASYPTPQVPGQPTQVDAAVTPAADLPAEPQPQASADGKQETLLRFSQWHYEGKKATHDAMDRQSVSFRSKMSTAAHFCSSDFQPDVYDPTGNE